MQMLFFFGIEKYKNTNLKLKIEQRRKPPKFVGATVNEASYICTEDIFYYQVDTSLSEFNRFDLFIDLLAVGTWNPRRPDPTQT